MASDKDETLFTRGGNMSAVLFTPIFFIVITIVCSILIIVLVTLFCHTSSAVSKYYKRSFRYEYMRSLAVLGVIIMICGDLLIIVEPQDWQSFNSVSVGMILFGGLSSLCIVIWELFGTKAYR
jgi:hypothetical protein